LGDKILQQVAQMLKKVIIMASRDIVVIEKASLDAIKVENLIESGLPRGYTLGNIGHLFQRIHGKDLFVQLEKLEKRNLGTREYQLEEVL